MPTLLDVRPHGYGLAAHVLGDEVAELVRLVWTGLQSALDPTAGMAGSDSIGAEWGASYDRAAANAMQAGQDLANSCYQLAALLEQTGLNYAAADESSVPGARVRRAINRWSRSSVVLGEVPSAVGSGVPSPAGWSLLQSAIGYLWPDGHQDRLRTAAAAWSGAAGQLEAMAPDIGRAATEVMLQRTPESQSAFTIVDAMTGHVLGLADSYRSLGEACIDYAEHLDEAHHHIISEVVSFVEWTVGIEAVGGFFAVFTLGASEGAAQAVEAAEIGRVASRIRGVIETLQGLAASVRAALDALGTVAARVSVALRPVLQRQLEEAKLEEVSRIGEIVEGRLLPTQLPRVEAATTPEAAALKDLDEAASERHALSEIADPETFEPVALRGVSRDDLRRAIPDDWERGPSTSGGGEVFRDPLHRGRQIRIMPGYPRGSRPDLLTEGPYAVVSQFGVRTKVPLAGNPVLR